MVLVVLGMSAWHFHRLQGTSFREDRTGKKEKRNGGAQSWGEAED
jgi:hypothetical protein